MPAEPDILPVYFGHEIDENAVDLRCWIPNVELLLGLFQVIREHEYLVALLQLLEEIAEAFYVALIHQEYLLKAKRVCF